MPANKTQKTDQPVSEYIQAIEDETRRKDCKKLLKLMEKVTKSKAAMWGESIVGFGEYTYKYASGHSGNWPRTGFSNRKNALTIYLMNAYQDRGPLMEKLGKYKHGKSCVYVKKLDDIDLKVLEKLIQNSLSYLKKTYG